MPYPHKLLAEDEDVVRHLHPHWVTVFWPVVRFLLIVGATGTTMSGGRVWTRRSVPAIELSR